MGIYISLKFKARIKLEYVEDLKQVLEEYTWEESLNPLFQKWSERYRADFIPWGDNSQIRSEWDKHFEDNWYTKFNDNWWTVVTALKAGDEVFEFYEMLDTISDKIEYYTTWHELEDEPKEWKTK